MFSKNQLGFLCMFLSICAFSVMDLIIKWSDDYPVGEVLFFRGFFGLIPIFFLIPRERFTNFFKTKRPGLHFQRCLSGIIALVSIVIALRELPLATVTSITFAAPIFSTIMAIFFLNEKVGAYRWLAVIIGFIGILIIIEPGFQSFNIYFLYPVIFCIGLSYVAITIKKLSYTEPVWLMAFYFTLTITFVSLLTFPYGWLMPSVNDFIILSLVGLIGGTSNLLLSQAYKLCDISLVSPLKYLSLLFAIYFGYLFWDEVPNYKTLFGALLVIISSIIILRREMYYKKQDSLPRHE